MPEHGTVELSVNADALTHARGMQIQLPAGDYEIEGSATANDAPEGLTLRGAVRIIGVDGELLFERPLSLAAPDGSRIGEGWSGSVPLEVRLGERHPVTLPLTRAGRRPDGHADVNVTLNEPPDIRFVAISPDPVVPGGALRATVIATNANDPLRLVVTVDSGNGPVALEPAESLDDGVRFEGFTTAPEIPGAFDVEIRAIDPRGGETVDTKRLVVGDPEQGEAVERPDPVHDVAGLLVPSRQTLFVIPEDRDSVLEVLEARPLGDGLFVVNDGDAQVQFQVQEAAVPALQAEVRGPDLIEETAKTRIYKNAQCGAVAPGFTSDCQALDDGSSTHRVWEDVRRCERGDSYCVERSAVVGTTRTYDLADCQPPMTSIEPLKSFACR